MRQWLRSHLTYANVMVTILAFIVLGGGTALAAYVVSSNSQIGPGTVSGHKPPTGKHANLIAGSVNGQDIADNSLTGADIVESSLGRVPSATLGGLGRNGDFGGDCDPESFQFITCAATDTINLPAPTRVLIIGQIRAHPDEIGSAGGGECGVASSIDAAYASRAVVYVRYQSDDIAMSGVTGVLGPGPIQFGIDCNDTFGAGVRYAEGHVSVVELSPG